MSRLTTATTIMHKLSVKKIFSQFLFSFSVYQKFLSSTADINQIYFDFQGSFHCYFELKRKYLPGKNSHTDVVRALTLFKKQHFTNGYLPGPLHYNGLRYAQKYNTQKVERKTQSKISCHYTRLLHAKKIARLDDAFLKVF